MKTIQCWKVETVSDMGPPAKVPRFETKGAAIEANKLLGGYESNIYGPQVKPETITIYESATEMP